MERFRRFIDTFNYLGSHLDKIQPDKVYEELRGIFKELKFEQSEIDELISLVKMLDNNHLKILLSILEIEFSRPVDAITKYLDYKHCNN